MNHRNQVIENLAVISQRIANAERQFGREPGSVRLLAVSKTQPLDRVQAALTAGQLCFGENQLQDALSKITPLQRQKIEWHFIGPIQANKTQPIATHFSWVHSVDREKIAHRLSAQRASDASALNVCIQVNISRESTKTGVGMDEIYPLAEIIANLPRLRLRGLMAIPAPQPGIEEQRLALRPLAKAFTELQNTGFALDTLSMGMTDDLEAAIAEGATIVRIGTALFGRRRSSQSRNGLKVGQR